MWLEIAEFILTYPIANLKIQVCSGDNKTLKLKKEVRENEFGSQAAPRIFPWKSKSCIMPTCKAAIVARFPERAQKSAHLSQIGKRYKDTSRLLDTILSLERERARIPRSRTTMRRRLPAAKRSNSLWYVPTSTQGVASNFFAIEVECR
jgi:hypothetical protein